MGVELPALLTEAEAAERLSVSLSTIRRLRRDGRIGYVAITDRKVLYREEDCDNYLLSVAAVPKPLHRELPPCETMPRHPCVYFVRSGSTGPIKIGHAKSLRARLNALRTAHHQELILLATLAGGPVQEKRLHKQFAKHRTRGEWFEPAEPLLVYIEALQAAERGDYP